MLFLSCEDDIVYIWVAGGRLRGQMFIQAGVEAWPIARYSHVERLRYMDWNKCQDTVLPHILFSRIVALIVWRTTREHDFLLRPETYWGFWSLLLASERFALKIHVHYAH